MYDELVKRLRAQAEAEKFFEGEEMLYSQAADVIEELQQQVEHYHGCMDDWFEAAQEYKAAYIAEHDARIAECKRELMEKEQEAHTAFLTMSSKCGQEEPPKEE